MNSVLPSIFLAVATLTSFHYVFTSLVGYFSAASGVLTNKTAVPLWELIWFTIVADLSVVGMNMSLKLNSVGFYQVRSGGGMRGVVSRIGAGIH